MNGAFLNALGILLGALFGLASRAPLSARAQDFFRKALGAAVAFSGLRLVWLNVNGTLTQCAKQLSIALLAIMLGNLLGKILRLQKISNRLGRFAGKLMANTKSRRATDGLIVCTILFCAAPLGLLGAVADGLSGDFYLLASKAAMDALAMTGFMRMFGWPAALSAFPVYAFIGALTLAVQIYAKPLLDADALAASVNVAAGLVACCVALVIFEVRKVELVGFLPTLAVAPLFAWLLR